MIKAIIWDYDGTLANSNLKNYYVTLDLFENEAPEILKLNPKNLSSIEEFSNALSKYDDWHDLYKECYFLSDTETERLGSLWAKYQLKSNIATELFEGITDIINTFSDAKHAIISQNGAENIINTLKKYNVENNFQLVIGIDEYPAELSKPHHCSFIDCLEKLNVTPNDGKIIYIGDHEVDTNFVKTTQKHLTDNHINNDLVAIAVSYSGSKPSTWKVIPDYIAESTESLKKILIELNR